MFARIGPFVSEGLATDKINTFLDNVVTLLPMYFEIFDSGLWIEGWLY